MIEVSWVHLVLGSLVPLIVGVVTKKSSSGAVKGIANAILSAAMATVAAFAVTTGTVEINDVVSSFFVTFTTSIASYYSLLKPTGISEKVQEKTADFGV